MTARRAAGDRDPVGVAAVVGDVLPDPGQGAFDVDDVVGPGVAGADAVADGDADPALGGEAAHQRIRLRAAHADHPRPARHVHQDRRFRVGAAGHAGARCRGGWRGAVRTRLMFAFPT